MTRPVLYWCLWALILGTLAYLGHTKMHVREFIVFIGVVAGVSALAIGVIVATYREGDRITREPFDE